MNTFYIITNHQKDENLEITRQIQKYLEEHGKKCYIQSEISENIKNQEYKFPGERNFALQGSDK